uniref:Putative Peptidase S9, prolyl oligopeptidase active site domain protein n=1 Tax=mine drainage metagenome TaxID=410659 RepID=E6PDB9_9ZZZZ
MQRFAALLPAAVLALTTGIAPYSAAAAPKPPIALRDYRALTNLASPQFSPGGGRIAFLAVRADFPHDRYDASLMLLSSRGNWSTAGGSPRTLVSGMRGLHAPRWAPDGRSVAFIARGRGKKAQIFVVPAAGGKPRQLGFAPNGVEQFAWSPDGRSIAYVTPDNGISARAKAAHHDLFTIHNDDYQINAAPRPSHIWLLPVAGGPVRQLTFGPTSVLENPPPFAGSVTAPVWSPNGKRIVFTQQIDANDSDTDKTTIVAVDVATGAVRALTNTPSFEYTPSFSPNGKTVAFLYPEGPGPLSHMNLYTVPAGGGAMHDVGAHDGDVASEYAWLPNGRGFLAIVNVGVGTDIIDQPIGGASIVLDRLGTRALQLAPSSLAVSSKGAVAFVADNARTAPELYLLPTIQSAKIRGALVKLTSLNAAFADYAYPQSEAVNWKAPDGQWSDGILTYPDGYVMGKRYPLVVFNHGGPEAASSENFVGGEIGPLRDLFAARGYLVFEPNYRGSDNLSNAHEHAIYRDPGVGPASDVMAGIQKVEHMGSVDTSRIAVVGHSYGGYLTTWLIAHYHIWRCAVVADGAVDWTEEYELAGDGNMAWARYSLGGSPWNPKSAALYRSGSPITYAGEITTPTLILSGTADITVPITESFALYHALASRHVPVRFIGIPGAHHTPQDPVHLELYYRAIVRWVAAHL